MTTAPTNNPSKARLGKHVVVVGCGNIGSFLVPLLLRMAEIGKLTLVDFDSYVAGNLDSQNISPGDVSKPKARVLARLVRRLNPRLDVVAIVARVENVPPGKLRGDVMLACLDSKDARRHTNSLAWKLGMPLLDAGIEASALLARVNVYRPADNQPCQECAWDQRDYDQLNVRHPCDVTGPAAPPSGAPACLGALAAALQAIECKKILTGDFTGAGKQILIEAATHKQFVTNFRCNPNCRCKHEILNLAELQSVPSRLPVSEALMLSGPGQASLAFAGMQLAQLLACPGCGFTRPTLRLEGRFAPREKICPHCGRELLAPGFHSLARLSASELSRSIGSRSLASLGLREGDFFTVSCGTNEKIFELGVARAASPTRRKTEERRIP